MNFNAPLLRPIRILLFPFSLIYALIVWFRNRLFDWKLFQSSSFNLPMICVGNLSAGGTGKSPMVEWIIANFKDRYKVAVLSRGYKRKTRGYALANSHSNALEIGDEPMTFYSKFPGISVAVGEERIVAIPQLLHDRPETEIILLDDAFQHRWVKAGMNILLTDYNNLYTRDWFLPTGDLSDERSSRRRAQLIVVTKCRTDLDETERQEIRAELDPLPDQHLFFTSIEYGRLFHIVNQTPYHITPDVEVLLVTGIANPKPLKSYLQSNSGTYYEILYSDHHIFTIDDLKDITRRLDAIQAQHKIILTTEKDAVRLLKFKQELAGLPVYVMPITVRFLFGEEETFKNLITRFIEDFRTKQQD